MTDEKTTKHDINALNGLYTEGESCDQEIFAEQRSNLLLISGEHYNKRNSSFFRRLRESRDISNEQKLRLTKNHIQKITKTYSNNITSMAPGVGFEPKNGSELQDQKAAELHHAVWQCALEKNGVDEMLDDWVDSFVGIGEVAVKIFFDPSLGEPKAYEQMLGEDGMPMVDPATGQPVPDPSLPVYPGDFVFEEIYGFNLLRAPEAKNIKDSPWLCNRKMSSMKELKKQFAANPEAMKYIQESSDETFVIFDSQKGGYRKTNGQCMVLEYFFRSCAQYPKGYYFITTKAGVLAEGELPGGIYPIVVETFEKIQTSARGRSPVKHMRPYQAEINRAASKIAEHQITLGDDKVLLQNGTKISAGVALPGVRSINYTGQAPTVLNGRDGSQYLTYMQTQIAELYEVMNVAEDSMEASGQLDPYVMLFRSAAQKKKFQKYIRRFERFLINVCKTYLRLAKIHLSEDAIVYAVGRNERVNIAEFKNSEDIGYQIKVKPQADDIESKMGRQLVLNHLVQYTGNKLDKEDIGKLVRLMPYANLEQGFSDLTIDYDSGTNDILALDRGETPDVHASDNHLYLAKRLASRMRQADFKFLPEQVQNQYGLKKSIHEQMEAQRQLQLQRAKDGYIPTGGYLVVCDLYVADPKDPAKTRRARIPYEALSWLIKQLDAQGQSLQQLADLDGGTQERIATAMLDRQSPSPGANGIASGPGNTGNAMPGGAPTNVPAQRLA
jgi:hypothetical protein